MKQPQEHKKRILAKSSYKIILLLLAMVLIGSFLIWLNFQPTPIEETIQAPVIEDEDISKEVVQERHKPKPKDEPEETDKEGEVTYVNPPEEIGKTETIQPIVVVEERTEERDEETVLAAALPKVYTIYTETHQGSGFLYNNVGDIVTNAHVVAGFDTVIVTNNTGQQFIGRVIGISDIIDIALIRVEELVGKEPMAVDLMKIKEGTSVIAIGSPNNKANTATKGKVTATGREFYERFTYTDLYEMDAAIAPGSSGGPLLDALTEKVIGVNSIFLTDNPAIGYSIPIYSVYQLLKSWEENPILVQNPELPSIEDAYFDKELLTAFIQGYASLYTYAQNEVNFIYLEGYLLPKAPVYQTELETINSLKDQGKVFTVNKFTVDNVTIEENRSLVTATTEYVMTQKDKEPITAKEKAVFEVIIDEYGDYMIQAVTKTDVTTSEAAQGTSSETSDETETREENVETESQGE